MKRARVFVIVACAYLSSALLYALVRAHRFATGADVCAVLFAIVFLSLQWILRRALKRPLVSLVLGAAITLCSPFLVAAVCIATGALHSDIAIALIAYTLCYLPLYLALIIGVFGQPDTNAS